jgi:hypothetical protein
MKQIIAKFLISLAILFQSPLTWDNGGNPRWYISSNCSLVINSCTGDLYQVTGDTPPTVTWNSANQAVTPVGSISFVFTDGSIGTMSYTINGAMARS